MVTRTIERVPSPIGSHLHRLPCGVAFPLIVSLSHLSHSLYYNSSRPRSIPFSPSLSPCPPLSLRPLSHRYLDYNGHAGSYTWKTLDEGDFRPLDMDVRHSLKDLNTYNEEGRHVNESGGESVNRRTERTAMKKKKYSSTRVTDECMHACTNRLFLISQHRELNRYGWCLLTYHPHTRVHMPRV